MRTRTILWIAGISLVFAQRGPAWGQGEGAQAQSGAGASAGAGANEPAQEPECQNDGVIVGFSPGSAELDESSREALVGVAVWLKANPVRTLHLWGYAHESGTTEQNLLLGLQRAESVKAYLVSQWRVDAKRIETIGRGDEVVEHLPANGLTVVLIACEPRPPMAPMMGTGAVSPLEAPPPAAPARPDFYSPRDSRFGWAIMAGGGYEGFTASDMRSRTNGGGAWDVRIIGGTRSYGGFEAAYVGSSHGVQTLGASTGNSSLVSNGIEGLFRLNVPIMKGASLLEPYAVLGLGWSHYTLTAYNASVAMASDFTSPSDNVLTLPFGAGFAYGYRALLVDVRLSYVATYLNNYLGSGNGGGTLNHWGVGGQIGWAY
jgi:hypothetical protein